MESQEILNMVSPVSNPPPNQSTAQPTAVHQASSETAPKPSAQDTVQVSNAAKALLQESLETSAQTAKEASSGDVQAIRLQARHAAAKSTGK